jgi:lipopolysaccharide biosynthesis protein
MRHDNTEERLVFVNAWNEWAEGAHLEPDMQNGYAYLNAVRRAVQIRPSRPKLAVVIHAFYPDVLPEILEYIRDLPSSTFIMATTTSDKVEVIRAHLCKQDKKFDVIPLENRGRDVLPFLKALEILVEEKFDYVAKVHTKKSLHRDDGGSWRRELYSSVLGGDAFYRSIVAMENDQGLAMLGPKGHLVSMDTYLGKNLDQILKYSQRLGLSHDEIMNYGFFAGTMFIARVSAIEPILRLGIVDEDFENEMGQIDGTLAHALERVFALCIRSNRLRLAFSENPTAHVEINRRYGFA